ncbi:hypothetical protein Tcan_07552 [Toxocara canis]|uniref:Uncharacterized protein n=1 Tax=Toxocara canis TaxID=6265 RepID=A0A0B2US78_TOXCA|nr:hypothetical protein Tcan_07552 [Toxocara canis]
MVEKNTKKTIRQTTPNTRFRRDSMIEGRNDTKGSLKIIAPLNTNGLLYLLTTQRRCLL